MGGADSIYKAVLFFQDVSLFFHTVFLYICCLFTVWQGLLAPRVLTLSASGIPPKRYIKDGDAECLILNFVTITVFSCGGRWVFYCFWAVYIDGSSPRM